MDTITKDDTWGPMRSDVDANEKAEKYFNALEIIEGKKVAGEARQKFFEFWMRYHHYGPFWNAPQDWIVNNGDTSGAIAIRKYGIKSPHGIGNISFATQFDSPP